MASYRLLSFVLLFSLQLSTPIFGRKVKERWSGLARNHTLRAILPVTQKGALMKATTPAPALELAELIFGIFGDWDAVEVVGMKLGERLPNGTYDGLIGASIAGRGDMMLQSFNPADFDATYDIPVQLGPVIADGQLAILSIGQESNQTVRSLLDFFETHVDGDFYFYVLIWVLIFVITYEILVISLHDTGTVEKRTRIPPNRVSIQDYSEEDAAQPKVYETKERGTLAVLKTLLHCLWLVTEVLLLTESQARLKLKIRKTYSLGVLTFSLILCVYHALDHVMWNCLSSELTVDTPARHVDSIEDLVNGTGRALMPIILTDFGALAYLKESSNPNERAFYRYIMTFPKESRVSFNSHDGSESAQGFGDIIGNVAIGRAAFIERSFAFQYVPLNCYFQPKLMNKLHVSRQTFGGGYFTFAYSPHFPRALAADLSFNLNNLIEMGFIWKGVVQNLKTMVYEKSEFCESPLEGLICEQEVVEKLGNDPRYAPVQEMKAFDLVMLWQVYLIYVLGMLLSLPILILEKGLYSNKIVPKITAGVVRIQSLELAPKLNFLIVSIVRVWKEKGKKKKRKPLKWRKRKIVPLNSQD